jgi:hypothetical protein
MEKQLLESLIKNEGSIASYLIAPSTSNLPYTASEAELEADKPHPTHRGSWVLF